MSNSKEVKPEHIVSVLLTGDENICSLNKVTIPGERPLTVAETLADSTDLIKEADDRMDCQILLNRLREVLTPRQLQVIVLRYIIPRTPEEVALSQQKRFQEPREPWVIRTMAEVGAYLGVSGVYIGEIEKQAIGTLQAPQNLARLNSF